MEIGYLTLVLSIQACGLLPLSFAQFCMFIYHKLCINLKA